MSDALNQVLDLIDALEQSESTSTSERQVVWRLTEAHTNSPPFTVIVEPFPVHTELSVSLEANRVSTLFGNEFRALLDGTPSDLMTVDARKPIVRALERNLNGIGRTEIQIGDDEPINLRPVSARVAKLAIERSDIELLANTKDWQRTEFGAFEGEISGLTRWNGKPALEIIERLSERRITCVLTNELSSRVGPEHQWNEVWEGSRVLATGALHYNTEGDLRRADLEDLERVEWTDVSLADLRELDVLGGKTLSEHLALVRDGTDG